MSIAYHTLHAQASEWKPESPIKDTSTWIAILVHTIKEASDLTQRSHFLWLKCNPRITIRTLKWEYFARHPLENVELKFWDIFPTDMTQVFQLREHQRKKNHDDQVVVLRAFEAEDVEAEEELDEQLQEIEEQAKIEAQVEAQAERGYERSKPIVLRDDDDDFPISDATTKPAEQIQDLEELSLQDHEEECEEEHGDDESAHQESNESTGHATSSSRESHSPAPSSSHSDGSSNVEDQIGDAGAESPKWQAGNENVDEPAADHSDVDHTPEHGYSAFDEETDVTHDSTLGRALDPSENGFIMGSREIPASVSTQSGLVISHFPATADPTSFAAFGHPQFTICDFCHKQMYVKPWTQYMLENSPLCTNCSRIALNGTNNDYGLLELNFAVQEELAEKEIREQNPINGVMNPQSMDEDAPLDWPHKLLRADETGQTITNHWLGVEQGYHGQSIGTPDIISNNTTVNSGANGNESHSSSSGDIKSSGPTTPSDNSAGWTDGDSVLATAHVGELRRRLENYETDDTLLFQDIVMDESD